MDLFHTSQCGLVIYMHPQKITSDVSLQVFTSGAQKVALVISSRALSFSSWWWW